MKFEIPEEYVREYKGQIYASRWKNKAILLLNDEKYKSLLKTIQKLKMDELQGIRRFFEAGIVELSIQDESIEIPKHFIDYIGSKSLIACKKDNNLIIKSKNQ